jgi:hypothetical protein
MLIIALQPFQYSMLNKLRKWVSNKNTNVQLPDPLWIGWIQLNILSPAFRIHVSTY